MPTVEGFTPSVAWTTLYGILALCIIFMIVFKVYESVVKISDRRKAKHEAHKPTFADEVSQKVLEKLEPRFKEIEGKLLKDKNRLDNHEQLIAETQSAHKETRDGLVAICKYLMAMSQYGNVDKNSKEMKEATAEMTQYLATKIGGTSK